ncbi:hypothetical protein [Mycolicibacterium sp. HK-90]
MDLCRVAGCCCCCCC